MDFVFWEDKMAFPGPQGRVGHPDLTQNIGQTRWLSTAPAPHARTAASQRPSRRSTVCPTA